MKTNVLIVAALFFAGTAMSQSVASKNSASSSSTITASPKEQQLSGSSTVSSQTKTNAHTEASRKAKAGVQTAAEIKESQEARVEETKVATRNGWQQVNEDVKTSGTSSTSVQTGSTAKIETKHNKARANSSLNAGAGIHSNSSVEPSVLVTNTQARIKKSARVSANTSRKVKSKADRSTKASVNSSSSAKVAAAGSAPTPRVKGNILSRSAVRIK